MQRKGTGAAASDPMPCDVSPMMAVLAAGLPREAEQWSFEFKWDGVRAIACIQGGRLRLTSRNRIDMTDRYPELAGLVRALAGRDAVLDGEIVALDVQGRPSFRQMQSRMHVRPSVAARRAKTAPVVYMIFDLLYLDGRTLMDQPYRRRRAALEKLKLSGDHWQTPPAAVGVGPAMVEAAGRAGLEGVIAKRLTSRYVPGARTDHWRKIKIMRRQEFVVGGWLPMVGSAQLGALLVGYYEGDRLRYAGRVGTGFTGAGRQQLKQLLGRRARRDSPFADRPRVKGAHYVEPELVAEVEFREWTHDGKLRHPSYKGLRSDKDPRQVRREMAAA